VFILFVFIAGERGVCVIYARWAYVAYGSSPVIH